MAHAASRKDHSLFGQTVEINMFFHEFLNQSNGSSCHECTEESTDADSIKMMKNQKGKKHGRCQTGEVKHGLDPFILLVQKLGQITRKNIGRGDRQQAVVGEADAETHQKKASEKVDDIQWQHVRQHHNPGIVHVDHLSESESDDKGKQIAGTERTLQNHQGDDKQRLENIVPRSETEDRKSRAEDERHGGNR